MRQQHVAFEFATAMADVETAVALQAGRLADMDFVAERITGFRIAD